jgi:hypothetical protein
MGGVASLPSGEIPYFPSRFSPNTNREQVPLQGWIRSENRQPLIVTTQSSRMIGTQKPNKQQHNAGQRPARHADTSNDSDLCRGELEWWINRHTTIGIQVWVENPRNAWNERRAYAPHLIDFPFGSSQRALLRFLCVDQGDVHRGDGKMIPSTPFRAYSVTLNDVQDLRFFAGASVPLGRNAISVFV